MVENQLYYKIIYIKKIIPLIKIAIFFVFFFDD